MKKEILFSYYNDHEDRELYEKEWIHNNYFEKNDTAGKYIKWGANNLFPEYLKSLIDKSSKHSAILKGKAQMISGNGFIDNEKTHNWITNPYNPYDTMDTILNKISYDVEMYGCYALNIVYSKDRNTISRINYVDPSKLRFATENANKDWDTQQNYWYSEDWNNKYKYKPTLLHGFNANERDEASQIYLVNEYRPGVEWYGKPEYIPAINWIELEWEISNFHINNIKNGFHPSMFFKLYKNGKNLTEDQKREIAQRLIKNWSGAKKAGNPIITFEDSKETETTIDSVPLNDSHERFIQLNNEVTNGIFIGHRVTNPILFGEKTQGELGGSNQIVDAMRTFQAMYVDKKQRFVEDSLKPLLNINGIDEIKIEKTKIELEVQINPADIINILTSPVTDNQKREIFKALGYSDDMANNLIKK